MMTVSALAIDGTASAIAPTAAKTYPSFFIVVLLHFSEDATSKPTQTFRRNRKRILNGCSAAIEARCAAFQNLLRALFDHRLINQRVDLLAVVPADRPRCCGKKYHREFFLRIGP